MSLAEEARACVEHAELSGDRLDARLSFPAALSVFAGHFPGHPVVPGVYLIEAVLGALALARRSPVSLLGVRSAKFTRPLAPDEVVLVEGRLCAGDELDATLRVGEQAVAKLSLRLG